MRVAVVCNDTRGGVQPYVALGLGLKAAGHEVRAVAPAELAWMFADAGLPVAPLTAAGPDRERATATAEGGTLATARLMLRELPARIGTWTREALDACAGAELLLGGVGGMVIGLSVAEKIGARFLEAHPQPVGAPTAAYPGVLLPGVPSWAGPWGRRLSHHLSDRALWMMFRRPMARVRAEVLGLAGRPGAARAGPVLYGFSPRVVPLPPGGGRERVVTGYWTMPAGAPWSPPPALAAFLARGGPVVSVGFGSMAASDPGALAALARGAARDAGARLVLVTGASRPVAGDDEVIGVEAAPHEWLFPRVGAVVHHGGAGTTGAALSAGAPSLVVPFAVDQPFWASRVAALGVGPAPIPRRALTRARLAEGLRAALSDGALRERAARLGALLRAEDGVGAAVARIERLASEPPGA